VGAEGFSRTAARRKSKIVVLPLNGASPKKLKSDRLLVTIKTRLKVSTLCCIGNTRMVSTQERDTTNYIATMEAANRATESQLFGNIASTSFARDSMPSYSQNIPNSVRYPNGPSVNDSASKVDYTGTSGQITGPSLLLKVMAGDTIMRGVQCYYVSNTLSSTNSCLNSVLSALAAGIMGTPTGTGEVTNSGVCEIPARIQRSFSSRSQKYLGRNA
jgi:hypothetical protein